MASHRAAARLWELPGLVSYGRCEVTVSHCHLPPRCGIVVHYTSCLLCHHRTRVKGIPVTTIERTLVDLGAVVSGSPVAMVVDDALRRRITTLGKLTRCLAESGGRGRRGAGVIRPILADRAGIDRAPEWRESFDRDRRRLSAIAALGWRLQLVTKADIDDFPDATINRILSTWRHAA